MKINILLAKKPVKRVLLFLSLLSYSILYTAAAEPPNIIMIFCDDLGYGDLGCFGNKEIRTPNIDRMAGEGLKFTEFYSASPVCSPSRAALLTGRIPQRMGINGVFFPKSYTGMPLDEITIADLLRDGGYATGIVGKWHLGHRHEFLPLQRGFDEYFGIPYSNDMNSVVYFDGNKVVDLDVDQHLITRTYTEKACDFIDRHAGSPFYLYLAHSMPHVPVYASPEFAGRSGKGIYTDVIEEIDWSVGEILNSLRKHGLSENTLVVFSSDNGPWLVMEEFSGTAGILREGKQYTFEGGQRVPTIAHWPGVIPPGTEYRDMAVMMDWFHTFADIGGVRLPADREFDGENILPVLRGEQAGKSREFLFYDLEELQAYRNGKWKLKLPYEGFRGLPWKKGVPPHDTLLFDLKADPGERINLCDSLPDKVAEMARMMEDFHQSKADFPPSLMVGKEADQPYYEILREKHGPDYYLTGSLEPPHKSPSWLTNGAFLWSCSPPLPLNELISDDGIALKDPSLVNDGNSWHLFTTQVSKDRTYNSMKYMNLDNLDSMNVLGSYDLVFPEIQNYAAPQVFYFRPQKKWYLIFQAQSDWDHEGITPGKEKRAPVFSSTQNIGDPRSWTKPERLLIEIEGDRKVPRWIDFWVICDEHKAHLFFTSDDGYFWHSTTSLSSFPQGWSKPEVALHDTKLELFEASCTYKLKGMDRYLTLIEAIDKERMRYYKAWLAEDLDGPWHPLASTREHSFAHADHKVLYEEKWTRSISHGELIRSTHDESLEIDPYDLQFLFQGVGKEEMHSAENYHKIPWKLGILEMD